MGMDVAPGKVLAPKGPVSDGSLTAVAMADVALKSSVDIPTPAMEPPEDSSAISRALTALSITLKV
jgi:hypothetical protein